MNRLQPSSERGVAMIVVMMALIAGTMLATVALAAAGDDMPFARASQDRKQAYAAAESGLEYYLFQLGQDTDYWTRCTSVPGPGGGEPSPVNQRFTRTGNEPDPRAWRTVPGTRAEYTIELLPPPGRSGPCVPGDAERTFLDQATGTFRIRASGRINGITRSIVSTLRRRSFLDFIYFTDLETADPSTYATPASRAAASTRCPVPRASRSACTEIQFSGADQIRGPFHTNDDILTCGGTTFGRDGKNDVIEISGPAGWQNPPGCSGSPNFKGRYVQPPPDRLELPTTNGALANVALPAYRFTGKTSIRLNGNRMDVTTGEPPVTRTDVPLPSNGVIYVANGSCSGSETPLLQRYDDDTGCANLSLSGTYGSSLTIASANDIVITGDVRRSGDSVLGLIANNFVRVAHPVTRVAGYEWYPYSCTNAAGTMQDVTIEAAILSLKHSFIVDNYACGAELGTLTVVGAIAQKFRGPVGTTAPSGYTKDYQYDDRLKYRSPPYFLDPVSAAWKLLRTNEQVPATR